MAVFHYRWGTERPRLRGERQDRYLGVFAEAGLARILRENETRLAQFQQDVDQVRRDREFVRLSTPNGRYSSEAAASVAAQFGLADGAEPIKRGRGRPPKYAPGVPRPPRPSRAVTPQGRLRAAAMVHTRRKRGGRQEAVSPVTSSPARSVAPKASPEVGRALLAGTIAANQEVAAAVDLVVTVTEDAIAAAPAVAEPAPFDSAALAARHQSQMLDALREFAAGDTLSPDSELVIGAYLKAHRREHHVGLGWCRGQDGAKRHDYDFSDPADEAKVKPEVRALFKGFGLSRHLPTMDLKDPGKGMSEEDLQLWMKCAFFNGVDFPEDQFDFYMRQYGSAKGLYKQHRLRLEPIINEERQRFRVWPYIERRLASVERYADQLARGEIDLTAARARMMNDEIRYICRLKLSEQAIYRKIVDAMTWFEGFSRIELLNWAGDDVANDRMCRIHQRFPAWAFPEELHNDVSDGWLFEEAARLDYRRPTPDDLVSFAEQDQEQRIENARRRGLMDLADIELPGCE
jgi:hypothetical protein